ncbi:hypothetical protein [Pseudomonas sp. NFACC39-1]|uniref:hypothetical protein n=1 Tax=Pseudomonas sp. NFACC39-1 TaxID=1566195 RepID=UPI0008C475A7|nr:hypothetical protein [Pseudomonas sp. NFACC39-1]SEO53017.1 hypothetical protein SAMN03159293_03093 [Pseudomonas sp. NFACC39-1]
MPFKTGKTVAQTTKYVIKYKLNGERRFEFAQLQTGTMDEAMAALQAMHGQTDDVISDVKVSKAL